MKVETTPTENTPEGNPPPRLGVLTLTDQRDGELPENWH